VGNDCEINIRGYSRGCISAIGTMNDLSKIWKHGGVLTLFDPVPGPFNQHEYTVNDATVKTVLVVSRDNLYPFFYSPFITAKNRNMVFVFVKGGHDSMVAHNSNRIKDIESLKPGIYFEKHANRLIGTTCERDILNFLKVPYEQALYPPASDLQGRSDTLFPHTQAIRFKAFLAQMRSLGFLRS